MELKDKIECLKFISQIHRSQFDERRRYEWKIVFTSLSFYVLCVAAVFGGEVTLPSSWPFKLVIWIIFLALAVIVAIFLTSLHTANNVNKGFAENAENAIAAILEGEGPTSSPLFHVPENSCVSWRCFFKSGIRGVWAWRWQVVTLLFFAIASAMLLTLK